MPANTLEYARFYLSRGWKPVPIPSGRKGPVFKGWQRFDPRQDELEKYFGNRSNIGLLLGEPSGWLVDVDLDCPEARSLAKEHLPPTPAVTGRGNSPGSHWWYISEGAVTKRYRDPVDGSTLLEIRSTGAQTVVGPSLHPEGDRYEPLEAEPAVVPAGVLAARVASLAEAVLEARHGPEKRPITPVSHETAGLLPQTSDDVERRAVAYLDAMPEAVSGHGGHNQTYAAATALVHGFGLEPERALRLLLERYNPRCKPPWTEKELKHKVEDAATRSHSKPHGWLRDGLQDEDAGVDLSAFLAAEPKPGRGEYAPEDPGPVPSELLRIPGFISEVMDFTLSTAPYPNRVLAFAGALALQAHLAGRKVRDETDIRPNLYLLTLANSGTGKEHPRKVNQRILVEAGVPESIADGFASGEGIEDRLQAVPSMLFQTDEIDGLIRSIDRTKDARHETIMSVLLKMYTSANAIYPMRVKAGGQCSVIDQPSLCLFGTAVPKFFYGALTARMLNNGFFARLLIIEADKRGRGRAARLLQLPDPILNTAKWWVDYRPGDQGNLSDWHPEPAVVPATAEARKRLDAIQHEADDRYTQAEVAEDPSAMAIWARAYEKVRKLALIHAVSSDHENPVVDVDAARWAWGFVDYQTRRMLHMAEQHVAESAFEEKCNRLVQVLRAWHEKNGDEWATHRWVSRKIRGWTPQEWEAIREALADREIVEFERASTGGRPKFIYRLCPNP